MQADQAIQHLHGTKVEIELPEEKVEVIDGEYECEIDDMAHLNDEGHLNEEQFEYIRQIRDAKVEIQQDGFNYTIDEMNGFKNASEGKENTDENLYNEYASEVINVTLNFFFHLFFSFLSCRES